MKILYVPSYGNRTHLDEVFKTKWPETLTCKDPDIIFVAGGDGGMLHAIQDYMHLNVPFFGIASGTLNFLMNNIDYLSDPMELIKNIKFLETHILDIKVKRQKSNGEWYNIFKASAANDIVIGHKIMDYHEFKINNLKEESFFIKGMGLIISTPLGSTAFHYNNGGTIIEDINSQEIAISSIVSEREKAFKIMKKMESEKVKIKLISNRADAAVFIDGQTKVFKIIPNDKIILKQGSLIKLGFLDIDQFLTKRRLPEE